MKKRIIGIAASALALLVGCAPANSSSDSSIKEPTSTSTPEETTSEPISSSETPTSTSSSSLSSANDGISVDDWDGIIRVYYRGTDGSEAGKNIYVWSESMAGLEYEFTGTEDGYGVYRDFDCSDPTFAGKFTENFYFIIKNPGTWSGQSSDTVVPLQKMATGGEIKDGRRWLYIYAVDGEGSDIDTFPTKQDALGDNITTTYLSSDWSSIHVEGSAAIDRLVIYGLSTEYYELSIPEQNAQLQNFLICDNKYDEDLTAVDIPVEGGVDPQTTYRVTAYFKSNPSRAKTKYATPYRLYDTDKFASDYTYEGHDLGVTYTKEATTFKVWAPTSARVRVYVYDYGTPQSLSSKDDPNYAQLDYRLVYTLDYLGDGVFGKTVEGDLEGKFYQFNLYYDETSHLSIDPYAKASGINGIRGAIIDFDKTDPEGWDDVCFEPLNSPNDLTVYEVHVRDFTIDETWNTRNKDVKRGTYRAFVEPGTTYNGVTTGFDSLKELGVNAVQILPIFDQDNEERTYDTFDSEGNLISHYEPTYNWGYNPENYNIPEGMYSSDPYDPYCRIRELKYMIMELSKAGMRTIMDVVYNHVSSVASHPFQIFAPRYYFRYTEDGYLIDDTGVNNTVNSDRPMASSFIVDSVDWWAGEYKMKGFRFDLMGVIDTATMRKVKDTLYDIDPEIVVYGEGWTGGGSHASSPSDIANVYAKLRDEGKGSVGVFNDCGRDGMKGNTTWANVTPTTGNFLDSLAPSSHSIYNAATMYIGENRDRKNSGLATPPEMTVNYISCHDNYTLYDQLNYQLNGPSSSGVDHLNAIEATVASTAMLLSGEGIAFIHGGEEIFRTKLMKRGDPLFDQFVDTYGEASDGTSSWIAGDGVEIDEDTWLVRNSYMWGDAVNSYKWDRKYQYKQYFDKYAEAIHARNELIEEGYLGHSESEVNSGAAALLSTMRDGLPAMGAKFLNEEGGEVISLLSGRVLGGNITMPLGQEVSKGTYQIIYSSSANRQGETINLSDAIELSRFEALILRYQGGSL